MQQDTVYDTRTQGDPSAVHHAAGIRMRLVVAVIAAALLLALLAPALVVARQEQPATQIHVVAAGETLPGIAARYGVTVRSIIDANNLGPAPLLRAGMQLVVPAPPGQMGRIHIVRRGETIQQIAARYGVTVQEILLANNRGGAVSEIYAFVGQRLLVPVSEQPPAMPTPPAGRPSPTATPLAAPDCPALGCEALSIITPTQGLTVTSPLLVAGIASSGDGALVVRVLDASGFEIGLDNAPLSDPQAGAARPFSVTIPFAVPASSQLGRVQVYSVDIGDGAIEHLASVRVTLRGAGLDAAIVALKESLEEKDYAALEALLDDPWTLGFYRSEGLTLTAAETLRQLRRNFLGPGDVFVDLSVDARKLLGDEVVFSPDITHVVFSTGWGPDEADDALLLFVTDDGGQTRWTGMLYIYDGLRSYELP